MLNTMGSGTAQINQGKCQLSSGRQNRRHYELLRGNSSSSNNNNNRNSSSNNSSNNNKQTNYNYTVQVCL